MMNIDALKVSLNKIKHIPQFDKDLLCGYIKTLQNDRENNIAPLIYSLCLLFYYQHGFNHNLCGFKMELSNDNTIVTNVWPYNFERRISKCYQTCYGQHIISSTMNGTYIWRLKNLTKENDEQSIYIGITYSNSKCINDLFAPNKWKLKYVTLGYAACCHGLGVGWKKKVKYTPCFNNYGDIITMKVIIKNYGMSIRFKINNDDETTLYDNLYQNENIQYILAVSMKGNHQTLQFIDFKRIPYDPQTDTDDDEEQEEEEKKNQENSAIDSDDVHYNYVTQKYIDPVTAEKEDKIFYKMDCLLYKLRKLLINEYEFSLCMNLLKLVIHNLIRYKFYDTSKYRKLNLNNTKLKKGLFKHEPAMNLLILIGFTKIMNHLVLLPQNENIIIISSLYHKLHLYHHSKNYYFNNFHHNKSETNCNVFDHTISPKIEKDIKIYLLDDLKTFKINETSLMMQQAAKRRINKSTKALLSRYRRSRQKEFKRLFPETLMGKELRDKTYGIKQRIYEFTLIRIEFPSNYVLEAKFSINEAIYKLFEFVDCILESDIEKIKYELILPPNEILKNMNNDKQTFKIIGGMIPGCTLRFRLNIDLKLDYKGKYISNEMIEKYLTKNITSLNSIKLLNDKNNILDIKDLNRLNDDNDYKIKQRLQFKKKVLLTKLAKLNQK